MRIKLDENIPTSLGIHLQRFGHIVRLNNPSRNLLIERISKIFEFEAVESWKRCLVVVTNRKIRIKRPE